MTRSRRASERLSSTSSGGDMSLAEKGDVCLDKKSDSLWQSLFAMDRKWTSKLSVCATPESRLGALRPLMKFLEISCHGVPWLIGNTLAILTVHQVEMHQKLLNLQLALVLDLIVVVILKASVRRRRPQQNRMDMFATFSVDKFAFPSGHATRAAMVTMFIICQFHLQPIVNIALVIWAVSVSLSRILLGRHHVIDVICGAIVGLLQYELVLHLWLSQDITESIIKPIQEELHL